MKDKKKTKLQLISELEELRHRVGQLEAEATLRQGSSSLRSLAETAASAIFIFQDSILRYANPATSKLTGYRTEELLGANIWAFVHPDHRESMKERVLAWRRGEPVPSRSEFKILTRDGETRWIDADTTSIEFEGKPAALTIAYDSTLTKLAEEALRETEQRINKIIETAQEAIWIVDAKAKTTYVNQRLGDMLGYAKDDLLGHSVFDFVDNADRLEAIEYLERGRSGIKEQHDFRFKRKDGSELWTMVSTTPLFDSEGGFIGGLAMLIDVTKRRRSDEALKESEARLQAAIENLPFELWARDNDGRCIIQNPYSVLQWGSFAETFPNQIAPDSETLALWNVINQRAYAGEVVRGESEITDGEQAGWYYYAVGPIRVDGEIRGILGVNIDITDRKRMEEALRQSEAKFRVLAQTIPAVIFIFQNSKIVYANSYAESHSGYSLSELSSMDFWELIHPDHRETARQRGLARLRGESVPSRYELNMVTKSGEERWVDFAASVFEFEAGPSVLGVAFDITDQKHAEEKLDKTQERLRHVVSHSPAIIYLLRVEGDRLRPEWVSDSLTRLTGYEPDEALSDRWWSDHIHADDREPAMSNLPRLLETGHLVHEYRFRHRDGRYLWIQDESTLLRDDSGHGIEVIGSCVDISERREAEAALRESEERFRTLVGSMDDIVATVDREHRYTEFFGRWIDKWGLKRESLIGKTPTEILGARAGQAHSEAIERGLSGEQVVFEWSARFAERMFHFQTCFSPIRDKSGTVTGLVGVARDISGPKLAEEALRSSEERYRDLVENALDIIYSHDLKGNYTSVNKAVERITGYTKEEALQLNFGQTVAPEYLERTRAMVAAKLAGQPETIYDLEIFAKDGHRIAVEVNTRLVVQDNKPVGIQGIARDVTARKQAEEALRASQERFHRYFDLGLIGMAITSRSKAYLEVNDQLCEILGYERNELLQMTWAETTHPDDLAANTGDFDRVLAGESDGYSIEKRYVRKDGRVIDAQISVRCVRCADGTVDYFLALTQDITLRKRAEQELRESQSRLQAILDHCPSMIFLKDTEGRYLQVNRVFEKTFNLTTGRVVGRTDAELFPPDIATAFRTSDSAVIKAGRSMEFEEHTVYADGPHTYLVHKFPLQDSFGNFYAVGGISTDITERKRAEDELRTQKERLQKIFDHIPVMLRIRDDSGNLKLVNQEWQRTLGWTIEELQSKDLDIFAEAYPDAQYRQQALDFISAATGEWVDFKTRVKDGRVIDTTWASLRLADGTTLGIGQDITERKRADELLRRQTAQLAALHEIGLEISAESDLSRVLEVVTHRASELLEASDCSTYILDRVGTGLKLVASLDSQLVGSRLGEGEGLAGRAVVTGEAQIVDDYSIWDGRSRLFDAKEFGPSVTAPLKWQQTVIGAISLSRKLGADAFSQQDARLLEQLAAEAAIAIHQATLFDEVQESQKRQQVLSHRLIEAQEAERKRLARELHDQIGQALTAVQLSLHALQIAPNGTDAGRIDECLLVIDDALQQVHDLSLDLRPSLLDDLGLAAALRWYVDRVANRAGLVRCFDADLLDARVAPQVETACFRIAQEALTNVLRHARAATVSVRVSQKDSRLQLVVRDDGVGFDVRTTMRRTGVNASLGLQGMQERAAAVGGNVDIMSDLGGGVEVLVSFPLS